MTLGTPFDTGHISSLRRMGLPAFQNVTWKSTLLLVPAHSTYTLPTQEQFLNDTLCLGCSVLLAADKHTRAPKKELHRSTCVWAIWRGLLKCCSGVTWTLQSSATKRTFAKLFVLVLQGEWGRETKYHYRGIYGDYIEPGF